MENCDTTVLIFRKTIFAFVLENIELFQEISLIVIFTEACEMLQDTQKWPETLIHSDKEHPVTVQAADS